MIVQGGLVRPIIKAVGERNAILLGLSCAALGLGWYGTAWVGWLDLARHSHRCLLGPLQRRRASR